MLFINDDQAEILQWSKDGGTGSDDNSYFLAIDPKPLVNALTFGQRTVEDSGLVGETLRKAIDELGGEADFGNEDETGFAGGEEVFDGLEVDFGFAAAGHAVEKDG